jgi:hypothetical protein
LNIVKETDREKMMMGDKPIKVEDLIKLRERNSIKSLKDSREGEEVDYLLNNHTKKELADNDMAAIEMQLGKLGRKTMEFRYRDQLLGVLCNSCVKSPKRRTMMELYNRVNTYVAEKLDIVHYIKSLEHIDRVKLLLLNTEQKLAFDFIKRPNLADQGELSCFEIDFARDKNKDAMCVINYYIKKAQEGTLDEKDREIFPLLEPSIKSFMFKDVMDNAKL